MEGIRSLRFLRFLPEILTRLSQPRPCRVQPIWREACRIRCPSTADVQHQFAFGWLKISLKISAGRRLGGGADDSGPHAGVKCLRRQINSI